MTVNEMVASIKGVAENAGDMSQSATNASSSATEMASSIEEVARNAGALSRAAEETASSIDADAGLHQAGVGKHRGALGVGRADLVVHHRDERVGERGGAARRSSRRAWRKRSPPTPRSAAWPRPRGDQGHGQHQGGRRGHGRRWSTAWANAPRRSARS